MIIASVEPLRPVRDPSRKKRCHKQSHAAKFLAIALPIFERRATSLTTVEANRLQRLVSGLELPRAELPRDAHGLVIKPIRLVEHRHLVVRAIVEHHDQQVNQGVRCATHPKRLC